MRIPQRWNFRLGMAGLMLTSILASLAITYFILATCSFLT